MFWLLKDCDTVELQEVTKVGTQFSAGNIY